MTEVTIYGGTGFSARSAALEVGEHHYFKNDSGEYADAGQGWPQAVGGVSSIKVPEGRRVILASIRPALKDKKEVLDAGEYPEMPLGWNDAVQIITVTTAEGVTIYGSVGFSGGDEELAVGDHEAAEWKETVGGISSMKVPAGLKATLRGGDGTETVLEAGDHSRMPTGWNDKPIHIKVEHS